MIDLGATECIPCKMMAPIIEELKKEYAGRANVIFIDVWKHPDQKKKYDIRAIPTQIFFDADGREIFRHTGFLDKARIVEILRRLGVS
jgi:thioredoxin 1